MNYCAQKQSIEKTEKYIYFTKNVELRQILLFFCIKNINFFKLIINSGVKHINFVKILQMKTFNFKGQIYFSFDIFLLAILFFVRGNKLFFIQNRNFKCNTQNSKMKCN